MKFGQKNVLITGASGGIGLASAHRFAAGGAGVAMIARDGEKLQAAKNAIKSKQPVIAVECDVGDGGQVQSMAEKVCGELGHVDILVNNAGYAVYDRVEDQSIEQIESQMSVNYAGMVRCTKAFLPGMMERRYGRIVNVASVAASMGVPGLAPYCASKSAMLGFSESLRHELHKTGVNVAVVSPIMVRTNFFSHKSFGRTGDNPSVSVSAERVARSIEGAVSSRRLEITVPGIARCAIWAKQTFPHMVMPYVGAVFGRQLERAKSGR